MIFKKNINILLTCVGGELSPISIKFIKKDLNFNIKVIGVDMSSNAVGRYFCDSFFIVPSTKSKNYIKSILRISKQKKINLIIPASDEEALILSKNKKIFEKNNIFIVSSNYNALKIFTNKYETYKLLNQLKIDKINYHVIKNKKELKNYFKKEKNKIVLKPIISRGGRGIFLIKKIKKIIYLNSKREIHLSYKNFKKYYLNKIKNFPQIVTDIFNPPVYDLDFLSNNGNLKKMVLRKRIISEEPNSGHQFCKVPKELIKKIKLLSKKLDLNSLHDIDLMKNNNGEFKILEINPRPSGSVSVTCTAGVNLLSDCIKMYLKKRVQYQIGVKNFKTKVIPYKSLKKTTL